MLGYYDSLFVEALRAGEYAECDRLLQMHSNIDINRIYLDQAPLLHSMLRTQRKEQAQFLLKKGADASIVDMYNVDPLFIACGQGYYDLVSVLVKAGANVNRRSDSRYSPHHLAVLRYFKKPDTSYFKTIRELIRHGADQDYIKNNFETLAQRKPYDYPRLSKYYNDSLDYHRDILQGFLYRKGVRLENVTVTGLHKEENRPWNVMIFTARGDFKMVVDFMRKNNLKFKASDFDVKLNNHFSVVEILAKMKQLDLICDPMLWAENGVEAERFLNASKKNYTSLEHSIFLRTVAPKMFKAKNKNRPQLKRR